jgi:pimeloyl-ACP methyl ester carboxylesterase
MSSSGNPRLSWPKGNALRALLSKPEDPRNPEIVIEHLVRVFGFIGSPAFPADSAELRQRVSRAVRRAYYPAGVERQLLAVIAAGDRRKLLRTIVAPTLVIHGSADPLVPLDAGRDTARNIPGSGLMIVDGMGHDLPTVLYERLADAIAAHCAGAARSAAGA